MPARPAKAAPPRKGSLARVGLWPVLIWAACLASPAAVSNADALRCVAGRPSNLDFMVLASMADSPQLFGLAGYRPTRHAESDD